MTISFRNSGGFAWIAAAAMVAGPMHAQLTGVSHPDNSAIMADPDTPVTAPAHSPKPSAAIPATSPTDAYGPYVPYTAPGAAAPTFTAAPSAFDPDANIVTAETAGQAEHRLLNSPATSADPDAGIV